MHSRGAPQRDVCFQYCHVRCLCSVCCLACTSQHILLQLGDHGQAGQHKYQLEEAQRAEKRVSTRFLVCTEFLLQIVPTAQLLMSIVPCVAALEFELKC